MSDKNSPLKTKLSITLKAGQQIVAESEDHELWQQVLAAISTAASSGKPSESGAPPSRIANLGAPQVGMGSGGPAGALARDLKLSPEKVDGAIGPSLQEPYLHLDLHTWAAWAKNIPSRGPGAVSPTALAATLLALWFRKAELGNPSIDQAQAVLTAANVVGMNPARSIRNCRWLQLRGESQVVLNPARIADAIEAARAFCSREKPKFTE